MDTSYRPAGYSGLLRNKAVRTALLAAAGSALLASCTSTPSQRSAKFAPATPMATPARAKEYFSEASYGVKASPRVALKASGLRRGGGRDQIGKPYKVRGRWYYPKEEPDYSKTGKASWYGAAFHGRLTANGEIYDMTHLSAAHPTMPLPSYARVTNLTNGSSVIVRVNDRGPYAHGRIIDLSKKAAEMLGYTNTGVADVQVDYVGRAPLEGRDDGYLLASYQPAGSTIPAIPQPSSDVMIAMNGTTPIDARSPADMAMEMTAAGAQAPSAAMQPVAATEGMIVPAAAQGEFALPAFGPLLQNKPGGDAIAGLQDRTATYALAYGSDGNGPGEGAFGALFTAADAAEHKVFVGTFANARDARRAAERIAAQGEVSLESEDSGGTSLYIVAKNPRAADDLLSRAWDAGFTDAFAVR